MDPWDERSRAYRIYAGIAFLISHAHWSHERLGSQELRKQLSKWDRSDVQREVKMKPYRPYRMEGVASVTTSWIPKSRSNFTVFPSWVPWCLWYHWIRVTLLSLVWEVPIPRNGKCLKCVPVRLYITGELILLFLNKKAMYLDERDLKVAKQWQLLPS